MYRPHSTPSGSATRVSGPYGLSSTVWHFTESSLYREEVDRVAVGRPQVLHRVRPPGAPCLGARGERGGGGGQVQLLGGASDAEVGGEEGVGVAEGAHGDGVDGPGAESGQRQEAGAGL